MSDKLSDKDLAELDRMDILRPLVAEVREWRALDRTTPRARYPDGTPYTGDGKSRQDHYREPPTRLDAPADKSYRTGPLDETALAVPSEAAHLTIEWMETPNQKGGITVTVAKDAAAEAMFKALEEAKYVLDQSGIQGECVGRNDARVAVDNALAQARAAGLGTK